MTNVFVWKESITNPDLVRDCIIHLLSVPIVGIKVNIVGEYEENMEFDQGVVTFVDGFKITNIEGYNGLWETEFVYKLRDQYVTALYDDWAGWLGYEIAHSLFDDDDCTQTEEAVCLAYIGAVFHVKGAIEHPQRAFD